MQIQPTISAGAAAGSVSQSTSKDRSTGTTAADAAANIPGSIEQVARSEQSSADRDAQGAGPMMRFKKDQPKKQDAQPDQPQPESLPVKSPEPPSQLDLLG